MPRNIERESNSENDIESQVERLIPCEIASNLYSVFIETAEQIGEEREKAEKQYGRDHQSKDHRAAEDLRDEALVNLKNHGDNCLICQEEVKQNSEYANMFIGWKLKGYTLKNNT